MISALWRIPLAGGRTPPETRPAGRTRAPEFRLTPRPAVCDHPDPSPLKFACPHGRGPGMSETFAQLLARVKSKSARVGVIGLGYVGLPLARAFTAAGYRVLGFDVDPHKVARLTAGRSYIKQIPDDAVRGMRERGFEATDRFDRLGEADAVLICVPTPLTDAREPDLTYVNNSALAVAGQLR